jgi:signal transduction histidine kinase
MFVLLFVVLINGFLGLLIFTRNTRASVNRLFLLLTFATYMWAIASYLTDNAPVDQRLLWGRIAFFFPVLVTLCLVLLSRVFPVQLKTTRKELAAICGLAAFNMLISLTPLVANSATIHGNGTDLAPGSMYFVFILAELLLFSYAIRSYVLSRRRSDAAQKVQSKLVAYGFMISFFWALLFNVLLTLVVPAWGPARFGPMGTVIFVSFTAYAIVKHKLFDIRLIVARSLAYIFSLLSLGAIFILGAFSITNLFFNGNNIDVTALRWLYAILAVILAALFPPLKHFFDKVTNRLFFRDAYDTRAFLDEFNKNLAVTRELDQLLRQSAKIIEDNIKPAYCRFVINGTKNTKARITGSGDKVQVDEKYMDEVKAMVSHTNQKLIVTDEQSDKHASLQKLLRQGDVVMLARLTPSLTSSQFDIGYLLLGSKKSGNLYSSQDLQVIEIIANELVIAVQNALRFEEIENFNITLQGRIDDATKKLRRANEKLRQMDETKDDFISMASHQLRTPLTSVKGYISMVLEGDGGKISHKQQEMLGQAFFSSQRMVYLIADLLNVSRLKTGKFIIDAAPVNLAVVVKEELEQLEETAASHSLKLTYDKPKSFPDLMLDETKTRQVIMNFVDNAIYYTPGGGKISVHLIDRKETVELRVEDDGIGVPKSEQPHLFTKFYRAGNARKARPDGTGLGLFMAKKVIVAQGGSLIFESQEGKGSTFGFVFSKNKLSPEKHKQ